ELLGVVPGQGRRATKPKVLAVVDTSGSIDADDLASISGELQRLARHTQVIVVECDVRIHRVYPYRRSLECVRGRGGTDLRPPFEREFLRKHRADLLIYFTDGYGPAPEQRPGVPVVWCLSGDGKRPAAWGRVVQMQTPRCV